MNNPTIKTIAFWLTVIGAVNWGLIASLKLNLVSMLFSGEGAVTTMIYLIIGASGLYIAITTLSVSKKKKK